MSMASDLMGLGVSPLQAAKTATGGTGPVTIAPAGTTFATGTRLNAAQYLVCAQPTFGTGSQAINLPVIGGDNGALIADDYIINNQGSTSIFVFGSTSVLISGTTSLSSKQIVLPHTTATFYAVQVSLVTSQANWIMVSGN